LEETYIWLEEVWSFHEVHDVECDLDPCLDCLDLLGVFGLVACEDDFSGSGLVGKGTFTGSSSGNVGDLSSDQAV
jgi:hypothetical protein